MDWIGPVSPIVVALVLLLIFRSAAIGLAGAVVLAGFVLFGGNPIIVAKGVMVEHAVPALTGPWHIGPILFTLLLGAFAAVLEKSGGFSLLMQKLVGKSERQKPALLGVFGTGLLCFFDGLANAMLIGRVARPITDGLKVSRQMLAYIIDSTSSSVACIAFISTWIASQLSYIESGLEGGNQAIVGELSAPELYFRSILANPYCWLALVMVVCVIVWRFYIGPMKKYEAMEVEGVGEMPQSEGQLRSVLLPILTLIVAVPACIYGFQEGEEWGWKNAFSGSYVPHAMVLAGIIALLAACISFPKGRWKELPAVMRDGAAHMLPALLILWLAWTLGSELKAIGLAERLAAVLEGNVSIAWFPSIVFILASLVSFSTGSSWGTMALFMATALPIAIGILQPGDDAGMYLSYVVGAVFGGAVFGDHCSPFSDTTVVSAMSAGCSMTSHVSTQLPYALMVAVLSLLAYVMMALAIPSAVATLLMAGVLLGGVFAWRRLK